MFQKLFFCQKFNFGKLFGQFDSNCTLNAMGKEVKLSDYFNYYKNLY